LAPAVSIIDNSPDVPRKPRETDAERNARALAEYELSHLAGMAAVQMLSTRNQVSTTAPAPKPRKPKE
jgi:hypothetical protein